MSSMCDSQYPYKDVQVKYDSMSEIKSLTDISLYLFDLLWADLLIKICTNNSLDSQLAVLYH